MYMISDIDIYNQDDLSLSINNESFIQFFNPNEIPFMFSPFNSELEPNDYPFKLFDLFTPDENNEKQNINSLPSFYSLDIIKKILLASNSSENIKNVFNQDKIIKKVEKEVKAHLNKKKRRKEGSGKIKFENPVYELEDLKKKSKRGRKKICELNKIQHNIYSSDNIITKIKILLFRNILLFLNTILKLFLTKEKLVNYNRNKESSYILKKINYKYITNIKKNSELELLSKPLKDIFSNDIAAIYKELPHDFNKKIIEEIMMNEKDNKNIMYAFNLTFREWIDIFTHKKEYEFVVNDKENIYNQFTYVDKIIDNMFKKYGNNKEYISLFILYIYNYERWFYVKRGRKRKKP